MPSYDYHLWKCSHCLAYRGKTAFYGEGVPCPYHGEAGSADIYFWQCSADMTINDWNRHTCLQCGGRYSRPPNSKWQ